MKTSRIWFCSFFITIKLDKTKKVNYNLLLLERINMFIGRKKELDIMEKCYRQDKFECVVIYGRRRVGKTTLINEFVKDKKTIFFTGLDTKFFHSRLRNVKSIITILVRQI